MKGSNYWEMTSRSGRSKYTFFAQNILVYFGTTIVKGGGLTPYSNLCFGKKLLVTTDSDTVFREESFIQKQCIFQQNVVIISKVKRVDLQLLFY